MLPAVLALVLEQDGWKFLKTSSVPLEVSPVPKVLDVNFRSASEGELQHPGAKQKCSEENSVF